jgi:uncharacterized membrane protein YvbJ
LNKLARKTNQKERNVNLNIKMKKQIITAIAIVFVVMYLIIGFIKLDFDFKYWSQNLRIVYIYLSIILSAFISWSIAYLNQDL